MRDVAFTTPTPFTPDGEAVDHEALRENLERLEAAGASLFVPCGNTGEYDALEHAERKAVVETHVDALSEGATVVGGLGGSAKTALDLAAAYEDAGADAVMVMNPVFTYAHEDGVLRYYRRIADATDLGVVLYKRGDPVTKRVVEELSTVENVVAVKYAVNDVVGFSQTVADAPGDVVFLNGSAERFALAYGVEGAEGYTTGLGNFLPEATLALHEAVQAGDFERARELRDLLRPIEDLRDEAGGGGFAAANNVPVVKYGQELAGLHGGPVRDPLDSLSESDAARLDEYYEAVQEVAP